MGGASSVQKVCAPTDNGRYLGAGTLSRLEELMVVEAPPEGTPRPSSEADDLRKVRGEVTAIRQKLQTLVVDERGRRVERAREIQAAREVKAARQIQGWLKALEADPARQMRKVVREYQERHDTSWRYGETAVLLTCDGDPDLTLNENGSPIKLDGPNTPERKKVACARDDLPCHRAAANGHVACLYQLSLVVATWRTVVDEQGRTPLFYACANGREATVHLLTDNRNKAQLLKHVNVHDSMGDTPLHVCVKAASWQCLKRVLEAGGNPMGKNLRGQTPAHIAEHPWILEWLVAYGNDIRTIDAHGRSSLHMAWYERERRGGEGGGERDREIETGRER